MGARVVSDTFKRAYFSLGDEARLTLLSKYEQKFDAIYKERFQELFEAYAARDFKQISRWDYEEFYGLTALALNSGDLSQVQFGTMRLFRHVIMDRVEKAEFVFCFDEGSKSMRKEAREIFRESISYSACIGKVINEDQFRKFEELCLALHPSQQCFFIVETSQSSLGKKGILDKITDPMGGIRVSSLLRFKNDRGLFDMIPSIGLVGAFLQAFFGEHGLQPEPVVGRVDDVERYLQIIAFNTKPVNIPSGSELPPCINADHFDSETELSPIDSYRYSVFFLLSSARVHPAAQRVRVIMEEWALKKIESVRDALEQLPKDLRHQRERLTKQLELDSCERFLSDLTKHGKPAFTVGFAPALVGLLGCLAAHTRIGNRKKCLERVLEEMKTDRGLLMIFLEEHSKVTRVLALLDEYKIGHSPEEKETICNYYEFLRSHEVLKPFSF